jgi:hypothetical protein
MGLAPSMFIGADFGHRWFGVIERSAEEGVWVVRIDWRAVEEC